MSIYLITDTHFNHKKIIEYCNRPLNYEERLFKSMDSLHEDDVLIHLGDVCIGHDEEVHQKYIMPLKCYKWLVLGNHDRKSKSWYMSHGWDWVGRRFLTDYGKLNILLSHTPCITHSDFDLNIHGHFHNTDHRKYEPIYEGKLTDKHKLLAVEYTNYQVVNLEDFINERTTT